MADADPAAIVADAIDARSLVELVVAAVGVPSVTPHEARFAHWVRDELARGGWDEVELRDAEPGRPNVYAASGAGDGRSLVLAGHLDTVHADDWAAHWKGTDRADPFAGHLVDGEIWGRGAADLKGGICTIIEVLRAVRRAGFRLRGRVRGLFVCDEESGQPGCGLSAGMRAAVQHLFEGERPTPDFAIYAEPTDAAVYTAQMGFLIADITLTGRSAYFGTPELGVDALRAGHALLAALWEHDEALRSGDAHDLLGDRFLLVTHVRSGESIAVPERFELSLIHKLLPGDDLDEAAGRPAPHRRRTPPRRSGWHRRCASPRRAITRSAGRPTRYRSITPAWRRSPGRSRRRPARPPASRALPTGRRSRSCTPWASPGSTSPPVTSPTAIRRSNGCRSISSWRRRAPWPISWCRGAECGGHSATVVK